MPVRAVDLPPEGVLRATVCIVGAGPAGLALAASLAESGIQVLVLEAADPSLPSGHLETVHSVGLQYDLPGKRGRGVGGGARTWNIPTPVGQPYLRLRELDDADFEPRPGVRETGWPFSKPALQPAYRQAWALFGLPPAAASDTVPAPEDGDVEMRVFGLGPASTFTDSLPRQLERSGVVRLVTGLVATELRTDVDLGTVSSVRCSTTAGAEVAVEAGIVVLAAGGIENARLLLASTSRHREGLGNAHDHVGRYFMEHPHYDSGLVLPADHRLQEQPALWDVHERVGVAVQRKYGLTAGATEREGLLSTAFYLRHRDPRHAVVVDAAGAVDVATTAALRRWRLSLQRGRLPVRSITTLPGVLRSLPQARRYTRAQALAAQQAVARQRGTAGQQGTAGQPVSAPPRTMTLRAMAEQLPSRSSRVRLGSGRDAFGMPTAELDWRLTDADRWSMVRSQELIAPYLRSVLGGTVASVLGEAPRITGGAHQMGTTKMSASPRDGVVDPLGRVHGTSNLYVTGASVFPTVGSANPTLTVVAMALRLGAHLRREAQRPRPVRSSSVP